MSRQHKIPPEMIVRLRSGRSCLDFAHTGSDEHMHDLVADDADLGRLLAMITDAPVVEVHRGDLGRARALREAIRLSALDIIGGDAVRGQQIAVVNAAALQFPLAPSITLDGRIHVGSGTATQALSTIARDAIDLFAAELVAPMRPRRLRECGADDCGLFILDTSRPNNRRWCSMELCGNRSKIRAYRARSGD